MAADLPFEVAQIVAAKLATIGHPYQQAAINATAEDLVKWCHGVFLENRRYTPEQQAEALIARARTEWEDGWPDKGGTKRLLSLFREMFCAAEKTSRGPENQLYAVPPPPACQTCDGTGWEAIIDNAGNAAARLCSECGGKRRPMNVCSNCGGKETVLVGKSRVPCSCLSPERRAQITEFLEQASHPMPAARVACSRTAPNELFEEAPTAKEDVA